MDETQATKASTTAADTTEIRQDDLRRVADHYVLNRSSTVDEHADLAMQLGR
jgi:hypothetical protein